MNSHLISNISAAIARNDYDGRVRAQQRATAEFAALNAWRVGASFRPGDIVGKPRYEPYYVKDNILDHCLHFRSGGRCAAIVAQPYAHVSAAAVEQLARQYGLECHLPPRPTASIYYPGSTLFIVFTAPGTEVRWLPEQLAELAVTP